MSSHMTFNLSENKAIIVFTIMCLCIFGVTYAMAIMPIDVGTQCRRACGMKNVIKCESNQQGNATNIECSK